MRWKPIIVVAAVAVTLGGCSFLSSGERQMLNRVSSEIGGKAVLEWDVRKRAVEWLSDACKRMTSPIEKRIDCVKEVLKLL